LLLLLLWLVVELVAFAVLGEIDCELVVSTYADVGSAGPSSGFVAAPRSSFVAAPRAIHYDCVVSVGDDYKDWLLP
jgi:hypothetical protein